MCDFADATCGGDIQEPVTPDDEAAAHQHNKKLLAQAIDHGSTFDEDELEKAAAAELDANPHLTPVDAAEEAILNAHDILGDIELDSGNLGDVCNPVVSWMTTMSRHVVIMIERHNAEAAFISNPKLLGDIVIST
jgi:hypothetical protein